MESSPQITIVIPLHNRAEIVTRTLDSIKAQTYRPLHLIVVDNNSSDAGVSVVSRWAGISCGDGLTAEILSEAVPGAAAARNRGLDAVTTEYTMFFDSDDVMLPGHVARAMEAFLSPNKPDLVGWDVEYHRADGSRAIKRFYDTDMQWNNIMHGSMSTQRYAARTELFRRAGKWNPECRGWNDVELGARILRQSPRILKLQGAPTVHVISTAVSITGFSFSSSSGVWETSLAFMRQTLAPLGLASYADLRLALLTGDYANEGSPEKGRHSFQAMMKRERSLYLRLIYRLAAAWTGHGLRGAARLLRPLFP